MDALPTARREHEATGSLSDRAEEHPDSCGCKTAAGYGTRNNNTDGHPFMSDRQFRN